MTWDQFLIKYQSGYALITEQKKPQNAGPIENMDFNKGPFRLTLTLKWITNVYPVEGKDGLWLHPIGPHLIEFDTTMTAITEIGDNGVRLRIAQFGEIEVFPRNSPALNAWENLVTHSAASTEPLPAGV